MRSMNASTLSEYLSHCPTPPLLLDVREPWEFEIVHISNSQLIPMNQLPIKLTDLDPNQETVMICHHGVRSRHAGIFLEQQGFSKIINLSGGIDAWARQVDPNLAVY